MSPQRAGLLLVALFALLCVFFTGQFPPFANPNELSRLETVYAVVEDGTFAIDRAITVLGDHEDKSASAGHFYSNKAPGLALAAVPVYRLLRVFFPRPHAPGDTIFILLRILVVSSVCCLGLFRFARRLGASAGAAAATFAVAFGTPFLFYARTFFSHAWVAALLWLAWDLDRVAEQREHTRRVAVFFLATGFVAMWATISEYPAAVIGLLLAWRVFSGRSLGRLTLFAVGAAIPLALLGFYDAVCFGSPIVLSSAREGSSLYAPLNAQSQFGFGWPSAAVAGRYLVDPSRGLLVFSPFFLWSVPGFWKWLRGKRDGADARFALSAVILYFILLSGYANWHGGWALGDRYLLPAIFFAAAPLVDALDTSLSRMLFFGAAIYSAAVHLILSATWPHFPPGFSWPVANGSLWFLAHGWAAPNLLSRIGPAGLLVPALITFVAGIRTVPGLRLMPPRPLVAAVASLLLAGALLWIRPEPSYSGRLWRAAVFGAYSGLDPQRHELRAVALSAGSAVERRQAIGAWRAYGPHR